MSYRIRRIIFTIVTLFTFSFSMVSPLSVYAQDENPPAEAPAGDPAPAESPEGEPEAAPADPAPQEAPAPAAEPEPVSVEEVLEQIPDSTALVVLDEAGEPEPLASEAAAEIIVNGDPMWCPGSTLPGGAGCTPAFDAFNPNVNDGGLLAELSGGAYSGPGTIYVAQGYNSSLEGGSNILLDGSSLGLSGLGNLTIQGGWDFNPLVNAVVGTSTFTGISLSIQNWAGSVTINDIIINNNNILSPNSGLYVESGGNIILNNVDAWSTNSYGADLVNDDAVSGTVQVSNSNFSDVGAVSTADEGGLRILSGGDVTLTDVISNDHQNYGAYIDTQGNVTVTNGTFNNHSVADGLFVTSGGNISLDSVTASNNLAAGAYLVSGGNISLDNVLASDNGSYGAYLKAINGTSNITVADSTFNTNGIKGLYAKSSGDISLDNVVASNNGSYGAYLNASYGAGDISVISSVPGTSIFNGNGSVGLEAMTGEGDITLNDVTIDGAGLTDIGAYLGTYDGGEVDITDSSFTNMTGYGLKIGSGGPVTLTNVTASDNGADGAKIFNPYACGAPQGIDVTVDGGTYQNNGGYGLYVSPGPAGTLTFLGAPTFGGNLDDYLLNLVVDCTPHPPKEETPKPPKKPINVVELPPTDGDPVEQDCEEFSGTELVLPNGTTAFIDCPFEGDSVIEEVGLDGLPAELPTGPEFVSGVSLEFNATEDEDGKTEDALVTLSFDIPEGMEGDKFSILFWDPEANGGLGDWVELPLAQLGISEFPLHPEDSEDTRMSSGVKVVDGKVTVTVNFPGTFVLVAR